MFQRCSKCSKKCLFHLFHFFGGTCVAQNAVQFAAKRKSTMNNLNYQFKIVDYLTSKGINPVGEKAGEILYYSPLTAERTPSFFVNATKNRFNDFSSGEKGDIFRLVSLLEKTDFKTSLRLLQSLKNLAPFSFSGQTEQQSEKIKILNVLPITKEVLKQYIRTRGIDLDLARKYVSEVHYSTNGRQWYALGLKNDSAGFELRNALSFKTKSINDISTIRAGSPGATDLVAIFEGMFDFLSALQYYGIDIPRKDTIILNSLSNLSKAITKLSLYSHTSSFLDNDKAGKEAYTKISTSLERTTNYSELIFPHFKDFNAYLIHKISRF